MLPEGYEFDESIREEQTVQPSKTYKIDWLTGRIIGKIDELEACIQFIRKVLNTDKYAYCIYDWYYGNDLNKLAGKPYDYIKSEIPRILEEALLVDDRITSITDYVYNKVSVDSMEVSCTVHTIFGDVGVTTEVNI